MPSERLWLDDREETTSVDQANEPEGVDQFVHP
jgi:hypothetical protein